MKNPKILIPVLLLVLGGVYKFVLAKPKEEPPKPKVEAQVYVMPKEFVVNLDGERLAKFNVALLLEHDYAPEAAGGGHGEGAAVPEGFGADPQEALLRDIIVDEVTGEPATDLTDRIKRTALKEKIVKAIDQNTDVKVEHLLFTDLAVQ